MELTTGKKSKMDFDSRVRYLSSVIKRMEGVRDSINVLCDCFLVRANDHDDDPLWHRFYTIQMCSYLVTKRNLDVSAPEGDMVYDLIRDTWLDVKDYMLNSKFGPVSNVDQWFRTIRIDFPVDPFDPDCTFFQDDDFEQLCQKGTKSFDLVKTV